jgi:hypothetical protein
VQALQHGAGRFAALPRPPDRDLRLVGHRNLPPRAQPSRRSVALAGLDSSHAVSTLILKRDGSGVTTLAVVGLRALANEASGHRGRA